VVKSSVESNLKEQFKSYSEAAAENVMVCPSEGLTDPATLKKVVKSVVQEEDRSKNVIIFGLLERKDEKVDERVQEVFQELGLKPTLHASRVGKIVQGSQSARSSVQCPTEKDYINHYFICYQVGH
jgi:hypothetical protein